MKDKEKQENDKIIIKGARTHNLKNVSLELPRNKMIVFTGMSGSGKSSLAFDTIFAEGQRKYVESLSAYARQFLRQMQKPDVDEISGLSPAISIDQKSRSNNPRSTVATITEIYDYLRVLYARVGKAHCLECGREVRKLSNEEILDTMLGIVDEARKGKKHREPFSVDSKKKKLIKGVSGDKIRISSPVVVGRKGEYYQLLYDLLNKGFEKVVVDGEEKSLRTRIELKKHFKHSIDVVVDEIFVSEFSDDPKGARERAAEAIERALHESEGLAKITNRLQFMLNVGIDYLTLDRKANTLSGGEAQRIRLASQLGSGLVGALYVLDEPNIGLHARDNGRLITTLLH